MRVLLSTYGSRGDVEPWWDSRCSRGHSARAEDCDALVATGVMPTGVWR
jgi:hypothetical protein